MDSKIARDWLAELARTANSRDYDAHMNLISKHVNVFGVPGFEVIGYDDWARQCRHEFANGLLAGVSYTGMNVTTMTPGRIMFKTIETVEGSDGSINHQGVEIVIAQEPDKQWRVIQERILPDDELAHERARLS